MLKHVGSYTLALLAGLLSMVGVSAKVLQVDLANPTPHGRATEIAKKAWIRRTIVRILENRTGPE